MDGADKVRLSSGDKAPDFSLRGIDNETYALAAARGNGWVLVVFFALDCQTCLFSFPYWDRLHEAYAGEGFQLWAIGLDRHQEVAAFVEKAGVTFPVLLGEGYRTTRDYDLIVTPAQFLVDKDGTVLESYDGFDRVALNSMAAVVAKRLGKPSLSIAAAEAPDIRPGCTIHV